MQQPSNLAESNQRNQYELKLANQIRTLNSELKKFQTKAQTKKITNQNQASERRSNTPQKRNQSQVKLTPIKQNSYRNISKDLKDARDLISKQQAKSALKTDSTAKLKHKHSSINPQDKFDLPKLHRPSLSNLSSIQTKGKIHSELLSKLKLLQELQDYSARTRKVGSVQDHYLKAKVDYQVFTPAKIMADPRNGNKKKQEEFLSWIRQNIIGLNTSYTTPMQLDVEAIYVDHTATNRPFRTVEIMVEYAKLLAANPHTQFSRFGKYSTQMMHYAHDSLLKSFSASPSDYVALPTGSGSTGAIQKTVRVLKNLEEHDKWEKPPIFITPYEHHSNILPWVEFYENINLLYHDNNGTLQFDLIEQQLNSCKSSTIIVTVSATSNVTSKITDLLSLNKVIKSVRLQSKKKIIFSVDCAAYCCHNQLNLSIYDQIDFAFLSPHKNLGGAESCGVLIARKNLIDQTKPTFPGGGTVRFVRGYTKEDVMYEVDVFSKEIAGTPAFLGFYRAALSFQLLKNTIGYDFIVKRQKRNTEIFFKNIEEGNIDIKKNHDKMMVIQLYGERDLSKRANVITFNFEYGKMKFIHHSFASLIYTDIFGIQLRSGCFCAGPYGIDILIKMEQDMIKDIREELQVGIMINKPGYLRFDMTFYLEEYQVQYIAKATILIAKYWKSLEKLYTICKDGEVILLPSMSRKIAPELFSLDKVAEAFQKVKFQNKNNQEKLKNRKQVLQNQLKIGEYIAKNPTDFLKKINLGQKITINSI